MHLIGLDIGTTGCKAIVFDLDGQIAGSGHREYGIEFGPDGRAEQDAEQVWSEARAVLREAVGAAGGRTTEIGAIGLSVQGDAIIPTDAAFRALHPAILGMDYRSAPQARALSDRFGSFALFQRTGMRPHPMNSLTKILLLRELQPELFRRAERIVTYADFILGKLGAAEAVIDRTMASRTMAFDLASRAWSKEILGPLDLDPALLSRPVASGTPVGELGSGLVKELGLGRAPILVAGGHDQTCAALGAGVVRPRVGVVSTGTAEVLSTAFDQPVLTLPMHDGFYPCYLHAKDGLYFTFSLNHVGGLLLRWYRDELGSAESAEAKASNRDAYALIDERMPDGPSPVLVLPHWNGSGTPTCDLEAKGAVVGLTTSTTRHDIAKAMLEALCFELRINLDAMNRCGVEVGALAAVGGGAKSDRWLQLKADVLNRPIRTLRCSEAACLGAALLAGVAAGGYASLGEAVGQTVAFEREFHPTPESVRQYNNRFQLYCELYPALRDVNRRI